MAFISHMKNLTFNINTLNMVNTQRIAEILLGGFCLHNRNDILMKEKGHPFSMLSANDLIPLRAS